MSEENNVLIRSARFGKEPVVLNHPRAESVRAAEPVLSSTPPIAAVVPEPAPRAPVAAPSAAAEVPPPVVVAEPVPPPPPAPTYEEFRSRFREELEQEREEARRQAHAEGTAQAQREVQEQYRAEIDSLKSLLRSAREQLDQQYDSVVDAAAEAVFEAVSRMLGESYRERTGVTAVVREVVRAAKDRSRLVVRVHPDDLAVLNVCVDDVGRGLSSGTIETVADDRVVLGGCLLETPGGNLDGRLEIQLQQLRDALLSARARWHEVTPA